MAALLISLIAAVGALGVGGIIGTQMTARKELQQQLRERMLGAADDFIAASAAGLSQLRALDPSVQDRPLPEWLKPVLGDVSDPESHVTGDIPSEVAERVQASIDEAFRQMTRIVLIFSPMSGAATEAKQTVTKMSEAWAALQWFYALTRVSESETVAERKEAMANVAQSLGTVGMAAASAVVPTLALGSAAIPIVSQLIAGALTSTKSQLSEAHRGAVAALDEASDALTQFATKAGAQALMRRQRRRWRSASKLTYTVTPDERIVASVEPRHERPALPATTPHSDNG